MASGSPAGALVRAARRPSSRCEPVRVARAGRVSRKPVRGEARDGALRPACLRLYADRSRRARAFPPGVVRAPRHPCQHGRLHRLSDQLDRGRGLRRGHRSRDAARGADPRVGGGQQLTPLPGAGDPRHRRRRPPRRVRAALCGSACTPDSAARALSRAGRLPAGRRQRRSRGCACIGPRPGWTSR